MPNARDDAAGDPRPTEPTEDAQPPEEEKGVCWVCGAAVDERHCKIICPRCGFMRDCSDP